MPHPPLKQLSFSSLKTPWSKMSAYTIRITYSRVQQKLVQIWPMGPTFEEVLLGYLKHEIVIRNRAYHYFATDEPYPNRIEKSVVAFRKQVAAHDRLSIRWANEDGSQATDTINHTIRLQHRHMVLHPNERVASSISDQTNHARSV